MMTFERPIPGQSLTAEPKSQAFERPPEISDPDEALDLHLSNLAEPGAMEDAVYFLEYGLDLVTLVEGILRSAVMEGVHNIDTSLIIAPAIHETIKNFADEAGISYEEGFTNEREEKALSYRRDVDAAAKMLEKAKNEGEPKREPLPVMMAEEEPIQEEPTKSGLMARV